MATPELELQIAKDVTHLIALCQTATADLVWISESDAPFEVLCWPPQAVAALTAETLLPLTHHPSTAPVKVLAVADFFAGATAEQDWFEEEERATAVRYRALVALLKQHLSDLTVYQVGAVRLDLYVVGRTPAGRWLGLATQASET